MVDQHARAKVATSGLVGRIVSVVIAVLVIALIADHVIRCYGKPLSREEAVRRADRELHYLYEEHQLGSTLPTLSGEE
jgi:hypothetical protein